MPLGVWIRILVILDKFIVAFGGALVTGFFAWLAKTLSTDHLNQIAEDIIEFLEEREDKRETQE